MRVLTDGLLCMIIFILNSIPIKTGLWGGFGKLIDPHIASFLTGIRQVNKCIVNLPTKADDGKWPGKTVGDSLVGSGMKGFCYTAELTWSWSLREVPKVFIVCKILSLIPISPYSLSLLHIWSCSQSCSHGSIACLAGRSQRQESLISSHVCSSVHSAHNV